MKRSFILFSIFFLVVQSLLSQQISPNNWLLTDWEPGIYQVELEIFNDTDDDLEITVLPDSTLLTLLLEESIIPPDRTMLLPLELDLREQKEAFNYSLIFSFSNGKKIFYNITSMVETGLDKAIEGDIMVDYFFSPTCRDCLTFLEKEIPVMEEQLGQSIGIRLWNIYQTEAMAELERVSGGKVPRQFPIVHYDGVLLAGFESIHRDFSSLLLKESLREVESVKAISLLPVLAAGLLDGVNPCAFSILIFLLSYLTIRKRKKILLLLTGLSFSFAVGLTYFLIGLGLFQGLRSAGSFPFISTLFRWIFTALLLVLSILSLRDLILIKKGKAAEMSLQLPQTIKKRMKGLVRREDKKGFGILSGFIMGFFISIYELGCTGQIYLPTLVYMVESGHKGIGLLLLYNLAFILPLIVVFILAYFGISSGKFQDWFKKNLALSKAGLALFFLTMAVLLWII